MQPFSMLVRVLSSPALLLTAVWCTALIGVAIGPIDYGEQPSAAVLVIVASALALFGLAYWAGKWCFRMSVGNNADWLPAPSARIHPVVAVVFPARPLGT